jgi:hypothetical protein
MKVTNLSGGFMIKTIFISLFILSNTFSHAQNIEIPEVDTKDFTKALQWTLDLVKDPKRFTQKNCGPVLKSIYQKLEKTPPGEFNQENLKLNFREVRSLLTGIRFSIRKRFKEFHAQGVALESRECMEGARLAYNSTRYLEEYFIVNFSNIVKKHENPLELEKVIPYSSPQTFLKVNPSGKYKFRGIEDLKSGDLVLTRGTSFVSATITRLGQDDARFSHLAMVHVEGEGADRKVYVMEALIENGSHEKDYIEVQLGLKKVNGKISRVEGRNPSAFDVILRYNGKDQTLAARASKAMYDRLVREEPLYDFAMDMSEDEKLFCAELVSASYKNASSEQVILPMYQTNFRVKNTQVKDNIGMNVDETFAPSDIEVDPRFDIVAEWTDYTQMERLHRMDAAMDMVFKWMDEDGYYFDLGVLTAKNLKAIVAKIGRGFGAFTSLMSKNMNTKQLKTIFYIEVLGDQLVTHLESRTEITRIKNGGLTMTYPQMHRELEKFRARDLVKRARWSKRSRAYWWIWGNWFDQKQKTIQSPKFHHFFYPKKTE